MTDMTNFTGIMCALVTPTDESGQLDSEGLERLLERVVEGGVRAVCPTGSTGEGARLSREQRRQVVQQVRLRVPSEIGVIPAPDAQNAADALAELADFADLGADAALLRPPVYYPMTDEEVLRYYEAVAERTDIPLLLYNIPVLTKVKIAPAVARKLAQHPKIIGLKDSSHDLEYFQAVLYAIANSDFHLLTGSDTLLLASLLLGGSGAIAASANLVPELGCALFDAATQEDWAKARALQKRLYEVISACRTGGFGVGWKAALELAGVCTGYPVPPALPLGREARAELAQRLRALDVLA